jgi:hypothetical protein
MAVPLAVLQALLAVEPAAILQSLAAGSLVLRRMDRRGHKSGTGAPPRRGFF